MQAFSLRFRTFLSLQSIASAGLILLISTTVVNAGNYAYNLIVGRWLGPSLFADVSLVITLFLVVTFITVTLQTTTARFAALESAKGDLTSLAAIRSWILKVTLLLGLILFIVFVPAASLWVKMFRTTSAWPFVIFGVAVPFYLLQGVDRGVLQGQMRFGLLSITYQVEMWIRLIVGLSLVALGWSVNGAILGLSVSFVVTWWVAQNVRNGLPRAGQIDPRIRKALLEFSIPVTVAQIGQILINNSDILLVRYFYPAHTAGQYAALALIGRIVFFATWSVVTTMFPLVTQRHQKGEAHQGLLWLSLGIVFGISTLIIAFTLLNPELIVVILFGQAFREIDSLLWVYASATAFYALANVIINYRLSLGEGRGTVFSLAAGVCQVAGIWIWHASLVQVVWVQVVVMGGLFLSLVIWNFKIKRGNIRNDYVSVAAISDSSNKSARLLK